MSGLYAYDSEGIYRCRRCGSGLVPGHNRRCRGKKLKGERKKTKTSKAEDERTAKDLAVGFEILGASEE